MIAANLIDNGKHLIGNLSLNFVDMFPLRTVFDKFKEQFPDKSVTNDFFKLNLVTGDAGEILLTSFPVVEHLEKGQASGNFAE